jgi:ferric-dicitrate binding protein FerR (iron transport regulator)
MRLGLLTDIINIKPVKVLKTEELEIIDRYIKGTACDSERKFVESLLAEGEANLYLRNCLERDWNSFPDQSESSEADLSHLLDRIYHSIRKNETNRTLKPLHKILRVYKKAAAILLIPMVLAGWLFYSFQYDKEQIIEGERASARIFAPMGSRVSFNLPDGTRGMLNSGSYLEYYTPFVSDRKVKLEGEAWLDISHDDGHPFEISTGSSVVKVLGTRFNISAYPAENYIEVVLDTGKVEYHNNITGEETILLPSERLVCNKGRASKSVVDPEKYNAWTEGKLIFRGDPMAEVARRIERWYNVKIVIADKELEKYSFRATFQDDKLEDVLTFLSMTSPIRYEISSRKLLPDGTLEKQRVTIYKKNDSV